MQVRDNGGWWRIVIDYGAKSAKFCLGEGERWAIQTSASTAYVDFAIFWRWLKTDLRLSSVQLAHLTFCGWHLSVPSFGCPTRQRPVEKAPSWIVAALN